MISALLSAVVSEIKSNLKLSTAEVGVQIDGQPPPGMGQRYISVHCTSWLPGMEIMEGIDEVVEITVTVTQKCTFAPRDRLASNVFLEAITGMEILMRQIIGMIHKNEDVITTANDIIRTQFPNTLIYINPLLWQGTDGSPHMEDGAWVWTDDENALAEPAALVLSSTFGKSQRINVIGTNAPQTYDDLE